MRLDPNVTNFVSQVVADRTLLIDENVLIPVTARYEDRHQFMSEAIRAAREAGLSLCTTQRFVDAVRGHADWALDLVAEHGTQSEEVMRAAQGQSGYAPNAFLKGYVDQDPDDHGRDFFQYLRDCFGGSYARASFDAFFEDQLGIRILDAKQLATFTKSKQDSYLEAVQLMTDWNQSRPEDNRKSRRRIESEVECLLLIADWSGARAYVTELTDSRGSLLTSGSSVARLARTMGLVSGPMMVASPEAVWELLTRLEPSQDRPTSFRSMMVASHFRMAGHFVQPENYRRFFRPLIAAAKREFEESRDLFEEALSVELGDAFLGEFNEEDWPSVVSGLQIEAVRQATERGRDQQRLVEENERLRSMIEDHEERERKRREFVARQRRGRRREKRR